MRFTIKPIGKQSAVEIHSNADFSEGYLVLECFEGFLGIDRKAGVYNWEPEKIASPLRAEKEARRYFERRRNHRGNSGAAQSTNRTMR